MNEVTFGLVIASWSLGLLALGALWAMSRHVAHLEQEIEWLRFIAFFDEDDPEREDIPTEDQMEVVESGKVVQMRARPPMASGRA